MNGDDNLRMLRAKAIERRRRLLANLFGRPSLVPPTRYLELTQQRVADIDAALHKHRPTSLRQARVV
ncbi:hypothetical protein [Belnapia moabensis]|uniref:hypothetical protein n=1 Tax=Belnapia moabensis TaxID=365533 RepID=UPI0012EDA461|nr:hypothetical protein [Belnapia moabensis]